MTSNTSYPKFLGKSQYLDLGICYNAIMADGSSGNLSGVLFEAGKTISDAGKKQAQAAANSAVSSITGNPKPLFGQKPSPFEAVESGFGMGGKKSPVSTFTQAQLQAMDAKNKVEDEARIKQLQKQLHDEIYFSKIRDAGQNSIATARKRKEEEEEQERLAKDKESQQEQVILPGTPLSQQNDQLQPVSVKQAQTKTEINRGTTG